MRAQVSVRPVRCLAAAVVLSLAFAGAAQAHDADLIYVMARHGDAPDVLVEVVTMTTGTLGLLVPLDADGDGELSQADLDARGRALVAGVWDDMPLVAAGRRCDHLDARAWLREGFVELTARFRCAEEGELRQDFRLLRVLPPNYRIVLGSQLDGEAAAQGFAQGALTMVTVPRPPPPGAWDQRRFLAGVEAGARRALRVAPVLAWLALLLSMGSWRRGLLAAGLGAFGAAFAGWVDLGWEGPVALVAAGLVAAARPRPLPVVVPVLAAAAIAAQGGGGPWPLGPGQGLGVAAVLLALSAAPLLAGERLSRRPAAWIAVRRVLAVGWVLALIARPPWLSW